jgi:hypothetical protein
MGAILKGNNQAVTDLLATRQATIKELKLQLMKAKQE